MPPDPTFQNIRNQYHVTRSNPPPPITALLVTMAFLCVLVVVGALMNPERCGHDAAQDIPVCDGRRD